MSIAFETVLGTLGSGSRGTVLVTGGAGYIGSLLVRRLLDRGYRVRVLDILLYGDRAIRGVLEHPALELVVADFRHREAVEAALTGIDAVIHLGGIVGDPACALDPEFTVAINEEATRTVADACAREGVERLIFASSCSVYGANDELLHETSALHPVSLYARTKIASEQMLLDHTGHRCPSVILRFATIYGYSHRPRFDLVVNVLTAKAVTEGRITVHGGDQWRPFVHVDDLARALVAALEAPLVAVAGQVFNVGSNGQNYRLSEVADIVQELIPTTEVVIDANSADRRNYRVDFTKIADTLGFGPAHDLRGGILELKSALEQGLAAHWREELFDNHRSLRSTLAQDCASIRHAANPTFRDGGTIGLSAAAD
jgi:nucleoside-diphosphate-sugar epimerase